MKALPLLTLATLMALPALGDTVKTDYDHNVDFKQLHTYCWGQVKMADPFFVSRVRDQVDHDLQARGWQPAQSNCDATVFVTGNIKNEKQVETYYNGMGWGGGWGWGGWGWGGPGYGDTTSTTVKQPVGSVVVDIFKNSDKRLIWRGMMKRDVSNKTEKNVKDVNKDIDKMFKDFPPKDTAASSGE